MHFASEMFYTIHFHFLNFSNEQTNKQTTEEENPTIEQTTHIVIFSLDSFFLRCANVFNDLSKKGQDKSHSNDQIATTATERE